MSQMICFDVVCLENVLLRHAFLGPQPPVRAADLGTKCLLWHHLATSVTMPLGPFSAFLYTMVQWRKLPSFSFVSNFGQIWCVAQNGHSRVPTSSSESSSSLYLDTSSSSSSSSSCSWAALSVAGAAPASVCSLLACTMLVTAGCAPRNFFFLRPNYQTHTLFCWPFYSKTRLVPVRMWNE